MILNPRYPVEVLECQTAVAVDLAHWPRIRQVVERHNGTAAMPRETLCDLASYPAGLS